VPYPLVSDELAVGEGEGLEAGALGRQLGQRGVRDQDALLQVHPLQLVTAPRQGLTNRYFSSVLDAHPHPDPEGSASFW
jgi:hypothetical protein